MLLRDQDRRAWDRAGDRRGRRLLERAAALRRARAATSCRPPSPPATRPAPSWEDTDWLQIVTLYDVLPGTTPRPWSGSTGPSPSPSSAGQAGRALADVDGSPSRLAGYHLFHATRAELLTVLGRDAEAAAANARALSLTANDAERRLLATRLHRHPLTDGS